MVSAYGPFGVASVFSVMGGPAIYMDRLVGDEAGAEWAVNEARGFYQSLWKVSAYGRPGVVSPFSVIGGPAIYMDRLASDEAAIVADQEQTGGGDFVDFPLPPHWNTGGVRLPVPIPFGVRP
jgi:hypothetical protein